METSGGPFVFSNSTEFLSTIEGSANMSLVAEVMDEQPDTSLAGLTGLAENWEACPIRMRARRLVSLLEWPSAETIGVPSMTLDGMKTKRGMKRMPSQHVTLFQTSLDHWFLTRGIKSS